MNDLSVSVIIPAYNAAGTIGRAIESLLAQTRRPDEIVVIDDGSSDDLPAAVRPHGDRVRLIRQPNGGAASARNLGIAHATGQLIAFLDADDYWEPVKLERQLAIFESHPVVGVTASRYFQQPPGKPRVAPPGRGLWFHDRVLSVSGAEAFATATKLWTSTVVVRREVLGTHRFVSGLEPAEDRDLWVRLVRSSPVYLLSEPLATAVLEPGSLSRTAIDRDCGNMLRVVHRHRELLGPCNLLHWERKVFHRWAADHLTDGRPLLALHPAGRYLRRSPRAPEGWWMLLKCLLAVCGISRQTMPTVPRGGLRIIPSSTRDG